MEDALQFLVSATRHIAISRYLSGASLTLIIYDWILVAGDEAATIWQTRWTFPKALYYFIRIITIPFMVVAIYHLSDQRGPLSDSFCTAWSVLITLPLWACFVASNWLFTLRLLALYRRRRFLVWFMPIFFAATYGVSMVMLIVTLRNYHETIAYFPEVNSCGALHVTGTFPAMFYAPVAYETFIFTLTAYRAYKDASILSSSTSSPFLIVLYRDGLICFVVLVAVRGWNIWIFLTQPVTSFQLGINVLWALNTVMSTRVYLNLVWLVKRSPLGTDVYHSDGREHTAAIQMRPPVALNKASLSRGDLQTTPSPAILGEFLTGEGRLDSEHEGPKRADSA